ncbi:MAG: DUF58 domain-containing protein [Planctomycetes bacterium]|nr:DUF58 domain-containing protein [Planctomycetota bacterium]
MIERLADPRLPIAFALPLFLGIGFLLGNGPLLMVGAGLAVILAMSFGMADAVARGLTARRRLPSRAFQGETIDVTLTVGNRSRFPLLRAGIVETFPPGEVALKTIELPRPIDPGMEIDIRYRPNCFKRRGRYRVGPVAIEARDPFGLWRIRRSLAPADEIVVLPAPVHLERLPFVGRASLWSPRLEEGPRTGESLEYCGIREWRPGDTLRRIHWPSTARLGRLVAREYEDTVANQVTVIIDLARASIAGIGRESTTEYGIRVAAAIASECVRSGHEVALYGEGERPLRTPLAGGAGHIAVMLEALALARSLGEVPFDEVVLRAASWIPHGSTAVAVFSSLGARLASFAEGFALLRAKRVQVVAVLIDDASFLPLVSSDRGRDEALADQIALRAELWALGIPATVIGRGDAIEDRLAEATP